MGVPGGTPDVLGHEHQPGLRPGCPRQGPSLVQCTFPAECCKENGQDVGQGQRLPLEAPNSPSSPPKSSNKKSNVSSRSSSSPSLALTLLISQSTRAAPSRALALPHAQSMWQEGGHSPHHPPPPPSPAPASHPTPGRVTLVRPFHVSSALTFAQRRKRGRENGGSEIHHGLHLQSVRGW